MTLPSYGQNIVRLTAVDLSDLAIAGEAAGDLIQFDGAQWNRLPVGNNNEVLVVSAGVPTWSPNIDGVTIGAATPAPATVTTLTTTGAVSVGGAVDLNSNVITEAGTITVTNAAGPSVLNEAATATNPTLVPNQAELDTGIGWAAADTLSFIVGGASIAQLTAAALNFQQATTIATTATTLTLDPATFIVVPDTKAMVIGNATQITTEVIGVLQVLGTGAADSVITFGRWSADGGQPFFHFVKSRDATLGAHTIVQNNDALGGLLWFPDDGTDFATRAAEFFARVDDATPAAGDIGVGFLWKSMPGGGAGASRETMWLNAAGDLSLLGGRSYMSLNATEIGFQVTNAALTVGSQGSVIAPYHSAAVAVGSDALFGNLDGAIGILHDTSPGADTIEVRVNGAWLSVGVAGYVIQRQVPWADTSVLTCHPDQISADGQWLDETRCTVCGEQMQPGDILGLCANGLVRNKDLHASFSHLHLEREPQFSSLAERVAALEEANSILRGQLAEAAVTPGA